MKESIFPVSVEWVYLRIYGGGLYSGEGANTGMEKCGLIAEILNASYSVGEDNGKAGKNQCMKYVNKCGAEMMKSDPVYFVRNRKFYKSLLAAVKNAYCVGFEEGSRERS